MSGGLLDPTTQEADEEEGDDGEEEQEEEGGDLLIWVPQETISRSSLFLYPQANDTQCGRQNGERERKRQRQRGGKAESYERSGWLFVSFSFSL